MLTKLLKRVDAESEELSQSYSMNELSSIREMIRKKEQTIEELNDKILEEITEEEIKEEIEEAHGYTYDIQMVLTKLTKINTYGTLFQTLEDRISNGTQRISPCKWRK